MTHDLLTVTDIKDIMSKRMGDMKYMGDINTLWDEKDIVFIYYLTI